MLHNNNDDLLTDRQTLPIFVCLVLIYGPFESRTFLSGSRKNSGNISLLKSKSKLVPTLPYTMCKSKIYMIEIKTFISVLNEEHLRVLCKPRN